jgi:hypothetical protein
MELDIPDKFEELAKEMLEHGCTKEYIEEFLKNPDSYKKTSCFGATIGIATPLFSVANCQELCNLTKDSGMTKEEIEKGVEKIKGVVK